MSKQQEFETKNLTFSENLQIFRNYVVDRVNSQDPPEKIFQRHQDQLTMEPFKVELSKYHTNSDKGFFKSSKVGTLTESLTKLYSIQLQDLAKESPEFTNRILKDRAASIQDEAKNLLSGTTFFSVELAVREIRKVRIENNQLKSLNEKLNTALSNLAANVKAKFGLKDKELDTMLTNSPNQVKALEESASKGIKDISNLKSVGKGNDSSLSI